MSRKLHILFLPHWYPSRVHRTNGNFIQRHAEVVAMQHRVSVLYVVADPLLRTKYETEYAVQNNVATYIVYFKASSNTFVRIVHKIMAYKTGLKRIEKFDLIHLNVIHYYGLIALYYKIIKGIPYVITEHWTRWNESTIAGRELLIYRLIAAKASYLLPVCTKLGENMRRKGLKTCQVTIPNSVDGSIFFNKARSHSQLILLHISTLNDKQKNISGILQVIKRIALTGKYDFELHIGGDGDLTPINKFRDKNKLQAFIQTFGELSPEGVAAKMRESSIFVMFSIQENQPCVINEAFACGLPVIATDVGGISEFFPDNFGILVQRGDEDGLYRAITACLEGLTFASPENISAYAFATFEKAVIASKFHDVYTKTLYD